MKKFFMVTIIFAMTICVVACGSTKEKAVESKPEVNLSEMNATEVVAELQGAGFPIDNIISYTEETDENALLGRPNQYTTKVNVADTRLDQYGTEEPVGISVEVFENNENAQGRKDYIDSIGVEMPMLVEYSFIKEGVLLRLNKALTPSQAEQYEKAFNNMAEGNKPSFSEDK